MVRIYNISNYEDQGIDEEPTDVDQEAAVGSPGVGQEEEMKEDSDADKEWEDLEDEMESSSDEEEQREAAFGEENIGWAKNKGEMEKKKRQDFFSEL